MEKREAEAEKIKHSNLNNKVLVHKKRNEKMQVVEIGIGETTPNSNNFYVYCKLKGAKSGDITETLDSVLKNYSAGANTFF